MPKLQNRWTTIGGYLLIAAGVLQWLGALLTGGDVETATKLMVGAVGGGVIGVKAADGGH